MTGVLLGLVIGWATLWLGVWLVRRADRARVPPPPAPGMPDVFAAARQAEVQRVQAACGVLGPHDARCSMLRLIPHERHQAFVLVEGHIVDVVWTADRVVHEQRVG